MVNNKFQLTKQSSESEIKAYFIQVLNLARSKEEFPVNLDEVWPLVYARRDKAVSSLRNSDLFVEGLDYQVFHQKVENLGEFSTELGKTQNKHNKNGKNLGGRPLNTYMLSVPCLEFFIARKVRPVFEVYRQVFHKVANGGISLGNQQFQSKPMSLEETLAPLARYNAMIEDRFDILSGTLAQADINGDELDKMADRCRAYYHSYRNQVSKLVYIETSIKLEGPGAFSMPEREYVE